MLVEVMLELDCFDKWNNTDWWCHRCAEGQRVTVLILY